MAEPISMVIIGATGDLTKRLLMPAIYRLYAADLWSPRQTIGYAPDPWDSQQFRQHLQKNTKDFVKDFDPKTWDNFAQGIHYVSGGLTAQDMAELQKRVKGPAIFYLSLPPQFFGQAAEALGQAGFADSSQGWRRLVVEKPFGWDLSSAQQISQSMHTHWAEDQIYRIDHFLGKETAQNVSVFRFVNRFLESIWNASHISHVQITFAETLGVEGRWQYYDRAGALRDMLQNHLLQLFTLVAMEPPSVWSAVDMHNHKAEVLRAVRSIPPEEVSQFAVRGQYGGGLLQGTAVKAYRGEDGISPQSTTETYAALKLYVDSWRWHGVPFYLRSGKRMASDYAEIAVALRPVPAGLFGHGLENWLVFQMHPEETIDLVAWAKKPGVDLQTRQVILSTPYRKAGEHEFSAYEQLLIEILKGDQSAFPRHDEVEEAWRIVDPIITAWQSGEPEMYAAGGEGPATQNGLMEPGHVWRPLFDHAE